MLHRADLKIPFIFSCIFNIRNSCLSWFSGSFWRSVSLMLCHPELHILSLGATVKPRGEVLRRPLGTFLSPLVIQPASRPQVPRTQTSRPESPGMTSPSPRIQIISTDSAVASPQRIQVPPQSPGVQPPTLPESVPKTELPEGLRKELCFLGIQYSAVSFMF